MAFTDCPFPFEMCSLARMLRPLWLTLCPASSLALGDDGQGAFGDVTGYSPFPWDQGQALSSTTSSFSDSEAPTHPPNVPVSEGAM